MAKRTKVQLKTKVDQIIKPNGNREITPEKHNSIETDIIDSFLNAADGGFVIDKAAGYSTEVAINDDRQFASKKYVDDILGGGFDPTQDYEFTGQNSFTQPVEIAEATENNHAVTLGQVVAQLDTKLDKVIAEVPKTGSFTVDAADAYKRYVINSSGTVTITFPEGIEDGLWWEFVRIGTGQVNFIADSGATLQSADSRYRMRSQYSMAQIISRGSNTGVILGDTVI